MQLLNTFTFLIKSSDENDENAVDFRRYYSTTRYLKTTEITIIDQIDVEQIEQIDLQNRSHDNQKKMACKIVSIDLFTKNAMP